MFGYTKMIIIAGLVSWMVSTVVVFNYGKGVGIDEEKIRCEASLHSLEVAIQKSNSESLSKMELQKDSFRAALELRSNEYAVVKANLSQKEKEIRRVIRESTDKCVNTTIPAAFK